MQTSFDRSLFLYQFFNIHTIINVSPAYHVYTLFYLFYK